MTYHPLFAFQPLAAQQQHQIAALNSLLKKLHTHSPFYKKLFREQALSPFNLYSLKDLSAFPTTSKNDIQQHNLDFLCVEKTQIREYTATSGTLGKPVTIALTENDLNRLAYNEQQSFICADAQPDDIFQLMLTLDRQFMAGMAYYQGIGKI